MKGVGTQTVAKHMRAAVSDLRFMGPGQPRDEIAMAWSLEPDPSDKDGKPRALGLTWTGRQGLDEGVAEILKNSQVHESFAYQDIEKLLVEFVLGFEPGQAIESGEMESQVAKLLNTLEQRLQQVTELTVAAAVFNLYWVGSTFPGFNVGHVEFMTYERLVQSRESIGLPEPDGISAAAKQCMWLTTSVKASQARAVERGLVRMNRALGLVAVYLAWNQGTLAPRLEVDAVVKLREGPVLSYPSSGVVQEGAGNGGQYGSGFSPRQARVDAHFLDWLTSGERPLVSTILAQCEGDCTDLDRRIINGLDWFSFGTRSGTQAQAYVSWMTAVEALLGHSDDIRTGGVSAALAERAAFLLGRDTAGRLEVSRRMQRLYSWRNDLVHGRAHDVEADQLRDMLGMALEVMDAVIEKRVTSDQFEELKREFELQKFSVERGEVKRLMSTQPVKPHGPGD
jgi:hypothetical protein